jgi:hypothetical protein
VVKIKAEKILQFFVYALLICITLASAASAAPTLHKAGDHVDCNGNKDACGYDQYSHKLDCYYNICLRQIYSECDYSSDCAGEHNNLMGCFYGECLGRHAYPCSGPRNDPVCAPAYYGAAAFHCDQNQHYCEQDHDGTTTTHAPTTTTSTTTTHAPTTTTTTTTSTTTTTLCGHLKIFKFYDSNSNGVWDSGEDLLPGFSFNVTGLVFSREVVTGNSGYVLLTCIPRGPYLITEQVPQGWRVTTDNPQYAFIANQLLKEVGFGNIQTPTTTTTTTTSTTTTHAPTTTTTSSTTTTTIAKGTLKIFKFYDVNENGIWDMGEDLLPGFGFNITGSGYFRHVITGSNGDVIITDMPYGLYTVTENVPGGWEVTTDNPQYINLNSRYIRHIGFGNTQEPTTTTHAPTTTTTHTPTTTTTTHAPITTTSTTTTSSTTTTGCPGTTTTTTSTTTTTHAPTTTTSTTTTSSTTTTMPCTNCHDTDGFDIFTRGYVSGMYLNHTHYNYSDYCGSAASVMEWACNTYNNPFIWEVMCPAGWICEAGACIQGSTTTTSSTTTTVTHTTTTTTGTYTSTTRTTTTTQSPDDFPRRRLYMDEIVILNDYVKPNEDLLVFVTVENTGMTEIEGMTTTVMIPDLGIEARESEQHFQTGEDSQQRIKLQIPGDAKPGAYTVMIIVSGNDFRRVRYREILVLPVNSGEVLDCNYCRMLNNGKLYI